MSDNLVFFCGWEFHNIENLEDHLDMCFELGLQYCLVPICKKTRKKLVEKLVLSKNKVGLPPLSFNDVNLIRQKHNAATGAVLSDWFNLDSNNEQIAYVHEQAVHQELMLSQHIGVPVVVLPSFIDEQFVNYARVIKSFLHGYTSAQYWLRVKLLSSYDCAVAWRRWDFFRTLVRSNSKLFVALELSSESPEDIFMGPWCSEVVKSIFLPCDLFLKNAKGFPVLKKKHQSFVESFFRFPAIRYTLTGTPWHPCGIRPYLEYMQFLFQKRPPSSLIDNFSVGYEDYLQAPLQPLMDNLESSTYEVFEMDPVKYNLYEEAIYKALLDKKSEDPLVVCVVGAGRGPLVSRCLVAAARAEQQVEVCALEKNPNAVISLQKKNVEEWDGCVHVVCADMRFSGPPKQVDLLVSELLGSFGDNELSPECLDGAQLFLREGGVIIPTSYTSFIAPLMAPKLHAGLDTQPPSSLCLRKLTNFETPYVVRMKCAHVMSSPQPLFTFTHPNYETPIDNTRFGGKTYIMNTCGRLHGIVGFFEAVLYKDIVLSILPETHSVDMVSWFPIYFPIEKPISVRQNDEVTIYFWRKADKRKVWYEWCVKGPEASTIHNINARSYFIGF
jgi:protein arginine N-methyltransferase 5